MNTQQIIDFSVFNSSNLFQAASSLFRDLGVELNSNTEGPLSVESIFEEKDLKNNEVFSKIYSIYFVGLVDDTVFLKRKNIRYLWEQILEKRSGAKECQGALIFAVEMKYRPTRTEISNLTREFNRIMPKTPAILLFKYLIEEDVVLSLSISGFWGASSRFFHNRNPDEVFVLRDVNTKNPHPGHIQIFRNLVITKGVKKYEAFNDYYLKALNCYSLEERFFEELSNWYLYITKMSYFSAETDKNKTNEKINALNRLVVRVIFLWLAKEKRLLPDWIFDEGFISNILKNFNQDESSGHYYKAILENVFLILMNKKTEGITVPNFLDATLCDGRSPAYGSLPRHMDLFVDSQENVISLFDDIPLLGSGFFDCLFDCDPNGVVHTTSDFVGVFNKQGVVPDSIFFGQEKEIDLNKEYGSKNKKYVVKGLLHILNSYKIAESESSLLEREVALDHHLFFQNLFAILGDKRKLSVGKKMKEFYIPMKFLSNRIDRSLFEYILQNTPYHNEEFKRNLYDIISCSKEINPFSAIEAKHIVKAIAECKLLDPICGSGAFLADSLRKMARILSKIDPNNEYLKQVEREKVNDKGRVNSYLEQQNEDSQLSEKGSFYTQFKLNHYARNLYLIEHCIYGADRQSIAIEIAKIQLLFLFLSEQKINREKENFGIFCLPNIDANFAAADVFINLEDQQKLSLIKDIEVEKEQMRQVRCEYFMAGTQSYRILLQQKYEDLRSSVCGVMKKEGFNRKVVEKISLFHQYKASREWEWFDPYWMLGVADGFDLMIGGYPYEFFFQKEFINRYLKHPRFKKSDVGFAKKVSDSYLSLLRKDGFLGLVIPGIFDNCSYPVCGDLYTYIHIDGSFLIGLTPKDSYVNMVSLFLQTSKTEYDYFHQ